MAGDGNATQNTAQTAKNRNNFGGFIFYFIFIEPILVFKVTFPWPFPTVPLVFLPSVPVIFSGRSVCIAPIVVEKSTFTERSGGAVKLISPIPASIFAFPSLGAVLE